MAFEGDAAAGRIPGWSSVNISSVENTLLGGAVVGISDQELKKHLLPGR